VLVGHSERRSIWGESDAQSAAKTAVALEAGLNVVLCAGETLTEREAGRTDEVVSRQLAAVAAAVPAELWAGRIVVAYEPVWAIGTGKVASVEQAQEAHAAIRRWLAASVSPAAAAGTRVIYGGSVTAANCGALATQADIDGFLVGGASLKPEFLDIIRAVATAKKA
jgi:triosephosphate isomerase